MSGRPFYPPCDLGRPCHTRGSQGFRCTREWGHDGPHAAHLDPRTIIARWDDPAKAPRVLLVTARVTLRPSADHAADPAVWRDEVAAWLGDLPDVADVDVVVTAHTDATEPESTEPTED